jgi:hypothetical protein
VGRAGRRHANAARLGASLQPSGAKGAEDGPQRWRGALALCVTASPPNSMFLCKRSAGKLPKKLNFSRLLVPPQSDLEAVFKKTSLSAPQSRLSRSKSGFRTRVGQQGTLAGPSAARLRRNRPFAWACSAPSARRTPPRSCRESVSAPWTKSRKQQMRQRRCHRPADPRRWAPFATPAREYRAHAHFRPMHLS